MNFNTEEPLLQVQASGQDASLTLPRGDVSGMYNQGETLGQTQDMLERFYPLAG